MACQIPFAEGEALRISQIDECGAGGDSYVVYGPDTVVSVGWAEELDAPDDRERTGMNGRLQSAISRLPSTKYWTVTLVVDGKIPLLDNLTRGARIILNAAGEATGAGMCSQVASNLALEIFSPVDVSSCDGEPEDLVFLFPLTNTWRYDGDTVVDGANPGQTTYIGRGYTNESFDIWTDFWSTTNPTGTATQTFDDTECFVYNKFASASRPAETCTLTPIP